MTYPKYLHGVHDLDGVGLMNGSPGWVVVTEAIGHDPAERGGRSFQEARKAGVGICVRLNNAHNGVDGTIPEPQHAGDFATRCANFVSASFGIDVVIIGNEPNHSGEWPTVNGLKQPILAANYAVQYNLCRAAIRAVNPAVRVLVAGLAPWNNESGDWLDYLRDIIDALDYCDGFALHAYTHGPGRELIHSEEVINGWHWHFRVYRDQLAILEEMLPKPSGHLSAYLIAITEADQNDPWADTNSGWVLAAYDEINDWNANAKLKIAFLAIYRSNRDDKWSFARLEGVKADFRQAVQRGYISPPVLLETIKTTSTPATGAGAGTTHHPPRLAADVLSVSLDGSAHLGATIQPANVVAGGSYWRVKRLFQANVDESKAMGPDHHILANVLVDGVRQVGIPLLVTWGGGGRQNIITKRNDAFAFSADQPLSPGDFTLEVNDGKPTERVVGIKMGAQTPQGYNPGIHGSTLVDFELAVMPAVEVIPPAPTEPPPTATPEMQLTHPISNPLLRWRISQRFGENPADYARFGMAGHNGIDFAVGAGTLVVACDSGIVLQSSEMPDYGLVVKLQHDWGESIYAHLSVSHTAEGRRINRGEVIAMSGWSGNVDPPGPAGAHLHFGIRIYPYTRGAPYDGFSDPLPYLGIQPGTETLPEVSHEPVAAGEMLALIKAAAAEFGIDWQMLASLSWGESSYDAHAVSSTGAQGLVQMMPGTWDDWGVGRLGLTDPFDPAGNLRAGAAYLRYLLKLFNGNERKALYAWNWGEGRVGAGKTPPAETIEFANKVLHGADLLRALGL